MLEKVIEIVDIPAGVDLRSDDGIVGAHQAVVQPTVIIVPDGRLRKIVRTIFIGKNTASGTKIVLIMKFMVESCGWCEKFGVD